MGDKLIYYPQQPILPIKTHIKNGKCESTCAKQSDQFSKVLEKELSAVKFSQHALQRLITRNISLSEAEMAKLNGAVEKAAQKGARESLILMNNDLAFIVSVKNKTVITAMDGASIKDNIFTNIDSAVII